MRPSAASICVLASALLAPAAARASITSDDFVAIVEPSAAFVVAAGELAQSRGDRRVRPDPQIRAGRAILDDLAAWRAARAKADDAAAHAPTIDGIGPISQALSVPLEAIARTASAPGYAFTRLPSATRLDAASNADLARLQALPGASFEALYRVTDLAALRRLEDACRDFVLNGDDPSLRALAVHALPQLRQAIAKVERRS